MSRQHLRLPPASGTKFGRLIDRAKPVAFRFDGKRLSGFAGDTLASALLANGVRTIGRSLKYHRPRGLLSLGTEDPGAIIELGTGDRRTPNLSANQILLAEGLIAAGQNAWPSVNLDLASAIGLLRPLLPPGFQHKTLKRPRSAWRLYERALRHLGGLGTSPSLPDPDRYEHVHAQADVLVVGGGLAGLAAAETAAAEGLTVFLVEETYRLGGIADAYEGQVDGKPLLDWVKAKAKTLAASRNVHILTNATVAGLYDHGLALITERIAEPSSEPEHTPRERMWKLRTKAVVLATGAHEKPLVFPDNDRPGIMLATSARLYLRRYGVVPGKKIVIAASGDEGYRTALDLAAAGVHIERVVDLRLAPNGSLFHIVKAQGMPITLGSAPVGTKGRWRGGALTSVTLANRLTIEGPALRGDIACDTLLVSGGWSPAPFLAGHLGARLAFDEELGSFRPGELPQGLFVAGAANGRFDVGPALDDGWRAGADAARHVLGHAPAIPRPSLAVEVTQDDAAEAVGSLPDISTLAERARAFVDLQNDVTVGDMEIAVREGFGSAELMKRYTGLGLGTDQGKLAVANAAAVRAKLTGTDPGDASHTTFRPPWTPVSFGAIAGARRGSLFKPVRETPVHKAGADGVLEPLGLWRLPAAFPRGNESREEAVRREVRAVRNGVGIFDASASVKIAFHGRDAAEFLDRMSATSLADIAPGTSRFALFLNHDGFVLEDAVVARSTNEHFVLSAGIGRAENLTAWFERWRQMEWPDLDVSVTDETERWGQVLLAGPRVPELLKRIPANLNIADFTTDSFAEGELFGVPARALATRYTASAEVEISVPAGFMPSLWDRLSEAGKEVDLVRFGTDALHRLRLEAGAFDLDRETDGTVTPFDLGLGDLVEMDKEFVGKSGLERPGLVVRANRRHLVGVLTDDAGLVPPPGAHLVLDPDQPPPRRVVGHVTSSGYSPTLRRSVALALISAGERHIGDRVFIVMSGEGRPVRITTTNFLSEREAPK